MRNLLLSSVTLLLIPAVSFAASDFTTHTHTDTPMELKSVSLNSGTKLAAVCFLGSGNCGDGKFNKGDQDMTVDMAEMCKRDGYSVTSCIPPKYVFGQCPYHPDYYHECREDTDRACREADFYLSCEEGKIADETQICPYDSSYKKCKCNPCEGYEYSYAEATAEGYIAGASCNSCGTLKYQRQNAPCNGFLSCECGGEIGASACKSGTNTLFSNCKECIKCDDECPSGYYKTAGANGSCSFGTATQSTECGTTCYQCKAPNSSGYYGCSPQCPEGSVFNNEIHDYVCNELTCRNKIKAKHPEYFYGKNTSCDNYVNKTYNFSNPFVGESAYLNCSSICPFTKNTITQSFYVEADFKNEFSECSDYCRPSFTFKDKTFQGNIYIGSDIASSSLYHTNIVIDGTLTLPFGEYFNFDNLTIKTNSKLVLRKNSYRSFYIPLLKNVVLYPGSSIATEEYYAEIYDTTIAGNAADTAVTMKNMRPKADITSAHLLAGTSGGLYMNMIYEIGCDMSSYRIKRNPSGKINIEIRGGNTINLFNNPGTDTVVTLTKASGSSSRYPCITLADDKNKKLCSGTGGNATITFLTDDYSTQVLPDCCSQDSNCTTWNTGTVKCEGFSNR